MSARDAGAVTTRPADDPALPWLVDRWTHDDGLPLDHLRAIAQDADGFLWIATMDGLVRFDGATLRTYRRSDEAVFSSNGFVDVKVDAAGDLWAVNQDGSLYRRRAGVFRRFGPAEGFTQYADGLSFEGGRLWARGWHSAALLEGGEPRPRFGRVVGRDRVSAVVSERGGRCWIVIVERGLFRCREGGEELEPVDADPAILDVTVDPNGAVLALTHRGVRRPGEGAVPVEGLAGDEDLLAFFPQPGGALWLKGTRRWWRGDAAGFRPAPGLSPALYTESPEFLDMDPGTLLDGRFVHRAGDALYADGARITGGVVGRLRAIFRDAQGDLWFGDEGGGLGRVRRRSVEAIPLPDGAFHEVRAVTVDERDAVWITGLRTVSALEVTRDGRRRAWNLTPRSTSPRPDPLGLWVLTPLRGLPGAPLIGLQNMDACRILPSSEDGACHAFDLGLPRSTTSTARVLAVLHGVALLGTQERLFETRDVAALAEGRPAAWRTLGRLEDTAETVVLVGAASGAIYGGTKGRGIYEVRGADVVGRGVDGGLSSNRVRALHLDDAGALWVGTEDAGLCRLDLSRGPDFARAPVRCVDRRQGLWDDGIHAIFEDDHHRLWLFSNGGIWSVQRADAEAVMEGREPSLLAIAFTERDGMPHRETNGTQAESARDSRGRLWFPTQRGVARVDPSSIAPPPPPPVVLESNVAEGAMLGPGAGELVFTFDAPVLRAADQVRYRHRLAGRDLAWSPPSAERSVTFGGLPPGSYTFEVKAGIGGVYGAPSRRGFTRRAAFRETAAWPALLAVGAAILVGAAVLVWAARQRRRRRELERLVAERTAEIAERNRSLAEQAETVGAQARKLTEADELKSRFTANISHELRTPLTLIGGTLADVIAHPLDGDDSRRLRVAMRNVDRLQAIVSQLLDAARIESGRERLRARRGELRATVARIGERFITGAERAGIALDLPDAAATGGAPILAWLDAELLDKILTNLLSNALRHTPPGGRVTVSISANERVARVEVTDTGSGIAPEEQGRIFERFYQVDRGEARRHEGAGIGLHLARELVTLHGGEIGVSSEVGRGSTFWFTLPLGADHLGVDDIDTTGDAPEPATPEPEGATPDAACGRPLVLVVEDHADMRAWIAEHLRRRYEVQTAASAEEALARIRSRAPALLVLDVMMPGMDGISLAAALRKDEALAGLRILVVSARGSSADRAAGLELADDYLAKPFSIAELLARAARLLSPPASSAPSAASSPPQSPLAPPSGSISESALESTAESPEEFAGGAPQGHAADEALRRRIESAVRDHLADEEFSLEHLARLLALSRRTLQRELPRLTGHSFTELVRDLRLSEAQRLLHCGAHTTVSEVAAAVGMSAGHFRRVYQSFHGHPPSEDLRPREDRRA